MSAIFSKLQMENVNVAISNNKEGRKRCWQGQIEGDRKEEKVWNKGIKRMEIRRRVYFTIISIVNSLRCE